MTRILLYNIRGDFNEKKNIVIFRCINRNGGFQCICDDGFSGEDGTTCKDIDECTENPTLCENGICLNDQVHK